MISFRRALVTGASFGLGRALCELLAARGIPLLLVARSQGKLEELAQSLPTSTDIYAIDLTDSTARKDFLAWVSTHSPDLIINNAGCGLYGPAVLHPIEEQSQLLELNVKALVEITLQSAKTLLKQGRSGTIMNISSAAAFFSYPTHCIYAASKRFVQQFSEGLDEELKAQHIRVLAACPGLIDTEFSTHAAKNDKAVQKKRGFLTLSPEEVASAILKQIERGKQRQIIDWKYAGLILLSRLLPKALVQRSMCLSFKQQNVV